MASRWVLFYLGDKNKMYDRAESMKIMRKKGITLKEIGKIHHISRQRVHQIIGNTGIMGEKRRKIKINFVINNLDKTNIELANIMGISKDSVSKYRMGLRHKISGGPAKKGADAENYVSEILNKMNIKHKLMSHKNNFDILLSNGKTADVKSTYTYSHAPSQTEKYYKFHTRHKQIVDFYICIIWLTKDIFIIPTMAIKNPKKDGSISFPWPYKHKIGKYMKYYNNFDLLRQ
jgi:DNA-binding CsgD family transcriptional regulator